MGEERFVRLFFTDGNWEQLWCCQYQALGVRTEIDFSIDSSVQFWVTWFQTPTPVWGGSCWVCWWLVAQKHTPAPRVCHYPTFQPLIQAFNYSSSFPLTPHSSWREQMERLGMNYMNESWKHKERMKTKSLAWSRDLYQQHQDCRDVFCQESVTAALHEVHFLLGWKLFSLFLTYYRALISPKIPTRNTPW